MRTVVTWICISLTKKISASCLDENVCLGSCRKYCSKDAWMSIMSVVDMLQKKLFTIVRDVHVRFMMKHNHQLCVTVV